ncbi:hypothetical protein VB796_08640 [Arcicella sp. LKC2W]|uniref:hypothetical protein n=1 Tax=Arcicella sp. LKC2W TaxID=2984198 RepID=UPI002B1FAB6E|nr:hypothetical protein [Arcicella sp. LKC2W]MEA5459101.1 hypothetical protein [Arcicella sp. LKC2W]
MKYLTTTNFARLLLILFAVIIALILNACMTYNKAKRRYANTKIDTVTVQKTVTVSIPKDSVIYTHKDFNDTIPFYEEAQQGRAKVRIEYKDRILKVKADCDSASAQQTVTLKVPQEVNTWGASPYFRDACLVLLGLFLMSLFSNYLNHNQKKQ